MNEQSSFIGVHPDEWSRAYLIQFQQNFPDGRSLTLQNVRMEENKNHIIFDKWWHTEIEYME